MLKIRKVGIIFVSLIDDSSVVINDTKGTSGITTRPEIAVGTHFYSWNGAKTTLVVLPSDRETSWSLLPSLVSLLSGSSVKPENTK